MRHLFSFWKSYSRNKKITFVLLCLFFFIASHTATIFEGSCFSSPCSSLNDSADVNTWMDRYGEIETRVLLAPTSLLIAPTLSARGYDIERYIDVPLSRLDNVKWFWAMPWFGAMVSQRIAFDEASESLDSLDDEGHHINQSDVASMRLGYALSKALILLSLPLWILYAHLIIRGWQKNRYTRIAVGALLLMLVTSTFFTWFITYYMAGTGIVTWRVLL